MKTMKKITDTYACDLNNCFEVFVVNLATKRTGKLRRHHEKCHHSDRIGIESHFLRELRPPAAKRVKKDHKFNVNDACVSFVAKDLRPFEAITKSGLVTLLSVFTHIGAVYGKMEPEAVLNLLLSRRSVSLISERSWLEHGIWIEDLR